MTTMSCGARPKRCVIRHPHSCVHLVLKAAMNFRFFAPLVVASLALASSAAYSQNAPAASPPPRPAASQAGGQPGGPPPSQFLTAAELAKVKAIIAPFKPATLTAEQAKLMKRSLRDAGLRRSPALDAALAAAGFSPAKLDELDPPPPRPAGDALTRPQGDAPPPRSQGDAPPPRPAGDATAPPKK
jgi:hypothetical protein